MRSAKYLNAREYAERLRLSENRDVQDFAEDFIQALELVNGELLSKIEEETRNCEAGDSYIQRVEFLAEGSAMLGTIEELIEKSCPEYADTDTDDAIADMIKRLHPGDVKFLGGSKLEYDL